MSDLMTEAIIRMPYELTMSDDLSRLQFYNKAQYLLKEWQHQQSRIDDLKKQLAIAVEALEFYDKCDHFINKPDGKVELVDHGCKATEALTRIKQLQEGKKS